ncbi:hypothetical protein GPECTOR_32g482 [Gonium pectorale]|uniref:Amidohydrolase 3 domain-containing protein n=1 Tax=Gonium pectorale TaxID=33097 RepID=A0A150GDG2_GONPE|nr:hypothetical protein GPECTOR_32g482 [Gonium pectorale]|eukprot:KXZ47869.1 hypothetical protein GPECTOR_32g482 [Gonium pectorale]
MLVRRGAVLAVGSEEDVRSALAEAISQMATEAGVAVAGMEGVMEHDLEGRFVMPGFVDAHVHVIPGGMALGRVDLRGAASRQQLLQRVAAVAGRLGPGEWVLGGQWDEGEWGGELPTAEWLDEVCGDLPAYLTRHDLHLGLANSAALAMAGIGTETPDPEGGIIDRHPGTGRPTGLLRERAMNLMAAVIPEASRAERRAALAAAARLALSRGVTTLEVYMPAAEEGSLPVRIYTHVPLPTWQRLKQWQLAHGWAHPSGRLFWGGVKEFADGSLGSRTALMWQPYSDVDPNSPYARGQHVLEPQKLRELAAAAIGAGLQVSIHAIGDRAVDEVVAAYEAALDAVLDREEGGELAAGGDGGHGQGAGREARRRMLGQRLRLRIEHVQHLSGDANATIAMARNGITPVPNPPHLLTDAAMLQPRLGKDRAARAFAFGSLVASGLRPAFASDWPVVDLQPWTSVYGAVHRTTPPLGVACAMLRALPAWARFDVTGVQSGLACASRGYDSSQERKPPASSSSSAASSSLPPPPSSSLAAPKPLGEAIEPPQGGHAAAGCAAEALEEWPSPVAAEQRLSLDAALLGHTSWAAASVGLEQYVGSLAPGRRADFVEVGGQLAEADAVGALRVSEGGLRRCLPVVTRTWLDGELAYDLLQV